MAGGEMSRSETNIPHSALYTAATWQWAKMPCADLTMPDGADKLFFVVNLYMTFYRLINPAKYSLHHTLLHRHAMINHLLSQASVSQVIEIAAGFSPRGAAVSEQTDVIYYEVDLADVVSFKRQQLSRTEQGAAVLSRMNFSQLERDILQLDFFSEFKLQPSFVITEGLMMYFTREEQMSIWRNISRFIRETGGAYVFDYIPLDIEPKRSWLGDILHKIKGRFGGDGQGYCYDQRSRRDIEEDLRLAGFSRVDVVESNRKAKEWKLPSAEVPTHVVVYHCS